MPGWEILQKTVLYPEIPLRVESYSKKIIWKKIIYVLIAGYGGYTRNIKEYLL